MLHTQLRVDTHKHSLVILRNSQDIQHNNPVILRSSLVIPVSSLLMGGDTLVQDSPLLLREDIQVRDSHQQGTQQLLLKVAGTMPVHSPLLNLGQVL